MESNVERDITRSGEDKGYRAKVAYEFSVDGVTYKGDRIAAAEISRDKPAYARGVVKRYPKGSSASVYYMPGNPNRCLLEPGFTGQTFIIPSVGLFVLLLGGVFLAAQISVLRNERKALKQPDRWTR